MSVWVNLQSKGIAPLIRRLPGLLIAVLLSLVASHAVAQLQVLEPSVPGTGMEGPCATPEFTIAAMPWPSGTILAHIHARLIEENFGCRVRVVTGDPSATLSAMAATRQPAAAPESWASRVPEAWNAAVQAGGVRSAGPTFSGGPLEAWFVPAYVVANNPGLTSASALADHWQVFAGEEGEEARFLSCPEDWACSMLNRNLLSAFGLGEHFALVEPTDRADLDQTLAASVAENRPVLAYYWQPNALVARLDLVALDMGGFDENAMFCAAQPDCVPFTPSSFPEETVVNALADWVFSDAPLIAGYFERARMPIAEMNQLLAWQIDNSAEAGEVAEHFVATRQEVWQGWVGERPDG